jgi:FixJ family two-component response regulator
VDDEEPLLIALRRLLRSASLDDCVVLDRHMPLVDGFSVPARLAETGIR